MDDYLSIKSAAQGDYRIKASKFFSFVYPISTQEEAKLILTDIRGVHNKANHHCYAYRLFEPKLVRSSDDGEPSGTAGKPILGQIVRNDLYDVLIVVVRYFGGTKLGVRGLIDAYQESAKIGVELSVIITKYNLRYFDMEGTYSSTSFIDRCIKKFDLQVIQETYDIKIRKTFAVAESKYDEILEKINSFKKGEYGYDNIPNHPVKLITKIED